MKAYISGALMGACNLENARSLYEQFAVACEQANWEAYLPHKNTDPGLRPDVSNRCVHEQDVNALESCNAVVAYLGQPSLGVGAEIVIAMQQQMPIVALFEDSRPVSRFVLGLLETYPNAQLCEFHDVQEACNYITNSLTDVQNAKDSGVGAHVVHKTIAFKS